MPRVVLLTTGGTISTRDTDGRGARPSLRGADLLQAVPGLDAVATVEVAEFDFIPGAYMTLAKLVEMSARAAGLAARSDVTGVVVTHGTDTLEESAYYLHLTVPGETPVVFTGAMRNASQIGFDGYRNLYDAIRTAASPAARGRGVLVVLNEEVHSARWVTKTNGQKEDTFKSPVTGPVGIAYGDRIAFLVPPPPRQVLDNTIEPKVDLIRLYVDADDRFLRCSLQSGARGIVLEAFGGGRVPPGLLPALDDAIAAGVAVVVATRCASGAIWDGYGYPGAFRDLQRRGVCFVHDLPGHKARLKLGLGLGNGLRGNRLRDFLAGEG
ncbi:MAG: asparaginase [Armatimonadota bacterium]|nr:asparaginase [Armatimonadota bacterium]